MFLATKGGKSKIFSTFFEDFCFIIPISLAFQTFSIQDRKMPRSGIPCGKGTLLQTRSNFRLEIGLVVIGDVTGAHFASCMRAPFLKQWRLESRRNVIVPAPVHILNPTQILLKQHRLFQVIPLSTNDTGALQWCVQRGPVDDQVVCHQCGMLNVPGANNSCRWCATNVGC